jgi:hypothetical protein
MDILYKVLYSKLTTKQNYEITLSMGDIISIKAVKIMYWLFDRDI